MNVRIEDTPIHGVLLLHQRVMGDERGLFEELWRETHSEACGGVRFVQDNHSRSVCGVVRGMHFQLKHPQVKLLSVTSGCVFDVVLDVRRGSPTFGRWFGIRVVAGSGLQVLIPAGVAHGFCVVSDSADVVYKCSDYYDPGDDRGVLWNDPDTAIKWPVTNPVVSAKDARLPRLSSLGPSELPAWDPRP
jgi:dTDP-4-dehydrorhamnose 3,5-epimerase